MISLPLPLPKLTNRAARPWAADPGAAPATRRGWAIQTNRSQQEPKSE